MSHRSTRCASFALACMLAVTSVISQPYATLAASPQQAQQEIPAAPPKPDWPEVADRVRSGVGQFENVPFEQSPLVLAPEPSSEAQASEAIAADLTFVVPAESERAGKKTFELAGQTRSAQGVSASPLNATAAFIPQREPTSESDSAALSPVNVVFKLELDASSKRAIAAASLPTLFEVDYGNVPIIHGGDFAERLGLYVGSDCAIDMTGAITDCAALTRLSGVNYAGTKRLVVGLDAAALALLSGEAKPDALTDEDVVAPTTATITDAVGLLNKTYLPLAVGSGVQASRPSGGLVSGIVILSAGSDSPTGDYGASPVGDVLDYQVGLLTGAAQTSYPIPVPPPAAGPAPDVVLNYDSGTIDGSGIARSAQPGPVGIGWTQKAGAIVRMLKKSPVSGSDNMCWTSTVGGDFVFSLNGVSSRLVYVSAGNYTLQDDPRYRVQMLTWPDSTHPDNERSYWLVTTPDGTKYRFGGEFEPETGADQNSVFWLPTHKEATTSSCNASLQNRAWQWNLDRIEDTNGNVVSYFYAQEVQYYNSNSTIRQYVRAGQLKKIEYSKRTGTAVQPHARVVFHTEMRCQNPTTVTSCDTTADYPDTPTDFQCGSSSSCSKHGATFWTYRRLHAVQTQVYDNANARWTTAGWHEMNHTFPVPPVDPNGYSGVPKLWLNSIAQRAGGDFDWIPYNQIEAEDANATNAIAITSPSDDVGATGHVDTIQAGDWLRFDRVNFGDGSSSILARAWSSGAMNIEVRLDSSTAAASATIAVPNQSSTWKTISTTLSGVTGVHDVYLYFSGAGVNKLKLNWFRFNRATAPPSDIAPVQYGYTMLAGRANPGGTLNYQIMPRVMTVTNELGGVAEFTYGKSHTTWGSETCPTLGNTDARPALDCFRAFYASDTQGAGTMTWWKYKVLKLRAWDTFSGNPTQTITYTYGTPIFAFYDDPTNNYDYWNDFRGHEVMTTTDASGVKVEHRFYRGLHGDKLNSSGGVYTGTVAQSDGATRLDYAWLRGKEFETRVIAPGGATLQRTLSEYTYTLTAGSGITGSYFVAPQVVTTTDFGTVNKSTQTEYAYDSYGNVTQEIARGDTSTTADDRVTQRSYAVNTSAYIVDALEQERLWTGTTPGSDGDVVARSVYLYDGASWTGTAPNKGNLTAVHRYLQSTGYPLYDVTLATTTAYDAYGRPMSATDPRNNTASTGYHPFYGYTQVITNALGHAVTTVADPKWGVPLTVTDADGQVTTLQYDSYGRRTKVWLPTEPTAGAASMEYVYDAAARPASVKSRSLMSLGTSTYLDGWTYVDGFGRELQSQRADVPSNTRVLTSKAYNALGQVAYASTPYAVSGAAGGGYVAPTWTGLTNYSYFEYDEQGRQDLAQTRSGASTLWSTVTVHDGWQTRSYDANGNRADYDHDAFGQLVKVNEYNSFLTMWGWQNETYTTTYGYDLRGGLARVTDTLGNTTVITYDLLGRKMAMSDPDMGAWQYGYDAASNLTWQLDARGQGLYLEYDPLNRLVRKRKDATNGPILSEWTFDTLKKGLLTHSNAYSAEGTTTVQTVSFDARNRPLQKRWIVPGTGGGTFRFDYGYDEANHPLTTRYPGDNTGGQGELVTRGFHAQTGQLNSAVSDDGTRFVDSTTYNPQGQVTEQRLDSVVAGLTRRTTYDAGSLRTARIYAGSGGQSANLQDLTFAYDNNGNIASMVDAVNSNQKQCYTYDWLNRLTGAFTGDSACLTYSTTGTGPYSHSYGYNGIGNIVNYSGSPYTYGSSKPHAVTGAFGNTYGYDANGNQTSRTIGGVTYDLVFDEENRITAVKQGTTTIGSFAYDADGNRVKGTVSGVTTSYVAGLYEYQAGATTKYYDGGAIRRTGYGSGNGIAYVLSDQLGSSTTMVSQAGTALSTNYYYPFGGNRGGSAFSDLTTKRFTGQYHEKDLPGGEGLSYYNARWYDPQLGRFVSADSIVPGASNPQALNRYSYAFNSPIVLVDPTGHDPRDDFGNSMNDNCNYAGIGCSQRRNPVVVHYFYRKPGIAWSKLPAGHRKVFKGLGYTEKGYNHDVGAREAVGGTHVPLQEDPIFWASACIAACVPAIQALGSAAGAAWAQLGAACLASNACMSLMRFINGVPAGPTKLTKQQTGEWGVQQVEKNLPGFQAKQIPIYDPVTGRAVRIYDGIFTQSGQMVEVKTTGAIDGIYSLKNPGQVRFDALQVTKPLYVFVNGRPSDPFINALRQAGIPWTQLHP